MTWMSKLPANGAAHFIVEDGTSACSKLKLADGRSLLAPFKCTWVGFRIDDHLCTTCRRLHPRACLCGRCRIVPVKR